MVNNSNHRLAMLFLSQLIVVAGVVRCYNRQSTFTIKVGEQYSVCNKFYYFHLSNLFRLQIHLNYSRIIYDD